MTEARFTAIKVIGSGVEFVLEGRNGRAFRFKHPDVVTFVKKAIMLVMPERVEFDLPRDTDEFLNIWFDFDEEGVF